MPAIKVTRSTLFNDADGDGAPAMGEALAHTIVIKNLDSGVAATGVKVNDTLTGSTIVPGTLNISPIAFNDAFNAVGNTLLEVGDAFGAAGLKTTFNGSVTSNDVDFLDDVVGGVANFVISAVGSTSALTGLTLAGTVTGTSQFGGTVTMATSGANRGEFTYISAAGFEGTDTFTYTIRDNGADNILGTSDDLVSIGKVTITVSESVWYIDSAAGSGGNGTSTNPFNSIAAFSAGGLDDANDFIHVKGTASGNLVLDSGQQLYGTGTTLTTGALTIATTGSNSSVTAASGTVVTLGTGNTIAGININGTSAAAGLTGTGFGTLSVENVGISTATGQILNLVNGTAAGTGVDFNALSASGIVAGARGVNISKLDGGSFTSTSISLIGTSGIAVDGTAADGIFIGGGSSSSFNLGNVTSNNTAGDGVELNGANGAVTIGAIAIQGSAGDGLEIVGATAGVTVASGNIGTVDDPAGDALKITSGTGAVAIGANIAKGASVGNVVEITGHSGGAISVTGSLSAIGAVDNGMLISGNTGGTITFSNSSKVFNTSGNAVALLNNGGSTVEFTNGGLGIVTSSTGAGLSASGGGTVIVSGPNNTIATAAGTALSVSNTSIGASGLTFVSISSNGAPTGIVLNNTGTTPGTHGGLTVTGDSGSAKNNSGGTISASTGAGISITGARDISIDQVTVQNGLADGILGSGVTNFSLTNSTIHNNGDQLHEHGVNFTNVSGTVRLTNDTFSNNEHEQVHVLNNNATSADYEFNAITVKSTGLSAAPNGSHGINMTANGSANIDVRVVNGSSFDNLFSNSIMVQNEGTGTLEVTVSNSTFTNVGASAINIAQSDSGAVRFYIHSNGTAANPTFLRGSNNGASHSINVNQAGGTPAGAILEGAISNNYIGNAATTTSANGAGDGIRVLSVGAGTTNVRIDNNVIKGVGANGINVQMSEDINPAHTMNATIFNNNVTVSDVNSFDGIRVVAGALTDDAGVLRLDMHDNTASSATGNDFTVRARIATTMQFLNLGSNNASAATVQNYLDVTRNNNPTGAGADWFISENSTTGGGGFDTTASVAQPTLPSAPMFAEASPSATEHAADGIAPHNPAGAAGDGAPAQTPALSAVIEDGVLSPAELEFVVSASIARWAAAGASAAQLEAMRAVTITVADLGGRQLGRSGGSTITVDDDAGGWNWFIDRTPGDDAEFSGSGTQLVALDKDGIVGTRIDLLTVIMHELGHQIGLTDGYAGGDRADLMYGTISAGERRLPGAGDAAQGGTAPVNGGLALAEITIGTIPAEQTVTITFRSTVDSYEDRYVTNLTQTTSVTGDNITITAANDPSNPSDLSDTITIDSLTLGNLVWLDTDKDGLLDAGEAGIQGVTLTLYADTNDDLSFDAGDKPVAFTDANSNGVYDLGETITSTATTGVGGIYSFSGLAPGNYIIVVNGSNFSSGGALLGKVVSATSADPNVTSDIDNTAEAVNGAVATRAIRLDYGLEPTNGDTNNTLDLAFEQPNRPPAGTDAAIGINEDAPRTLTAADFPITDPDGNSLHSVIVNSVGGGTLSVNGATVTSFPATVTVAQLTANLVVFTPTANLNGNAAASISFQVRDNGGTANGGVDTDQSANTLTFNIAAVNDPVSTAAPATLSVDEDSLSQPVTGLSISDTDAVLAPNGVYVVTLSSTNGTLTLTTLAGLTFSAGDGTGDAAMTFRGTLANINTALATANYTPSANYAGAAQIQISATDSYGGTVATGSGAATNDSDTIAVTVNGINDAPVLSQTPVTSPTYIEGGDTVQLLAGGQVIDVDAAALVGGGLTVSVSGTGASLSLPNADGFTGYDTEIWYGNNKLADISRGDSLVLSNFTSIATPAVLTMLLDNFYLQITGDNPGSADRVVTFTLNDGGNSGTGGAKTGEITQTIHVAPVNDAPSGANKTIVTSEDDAYTFTAADFGFSDVAEGHAFAGVVINGPASNGAIKLNGVAITGTQFVTATDIGDGKLTFVPDADEFASPYATFTFQVRDNGGTTNGGLDTDQSANTITINVTPDNQVPSVDLNGTDGAGTGFASAYTEGGTAAAIADTDVLITDPDAGDDVTGAPVTITNAIAGDTLTVVGALPGSIVVDPSSTATTIKLTGTGTAAQYEAAIEQITFSSTSNNPTAGGTNTSRTITVVVTDGDANSAAATASVAVTDSNDSPDGTSTTIAATEDTFRVLTAADFGFTDVDTGDTMSAVTITGVTGSGQIYYDADGTAGSGAPVAVSSFPTTYTVSQLGEGRVSFKAAPDANGAATGTIEFKVADSSGASNAVDPVANTLTVDVAAVNDAPVLNNLSGDSVVYNENDPRVQIDLGGNVALGDVDSANFDGGMLRVEYGHQASDRLAVANTGGVSIVSGTQVFVNDGTTNVQIGTLAVYTSGGQRGLEITLDADATPARVQQLLRAFRFDNSSDNPVGGARSFTWTLTDGDGGTATATSTATVNPLNDRPTVVGNHFMEIAGVEDQSSNLPADYKTVQEIFGASFSDAADGNANSFAGIAIQSIAAPADGVWQYHNGSAWFDFGTVSPSSALTLTPQTAIRFVPAAANYAGSSGTTLYVVLIESSDTPVVNGGTANTSGQGATSRFSGHQIATYAYFAPVNDAPELSAPTAATLVYTENDPSVPLMQGVTVSDVDFPSDYQGGGLTLSVSGGAGSGGVNLRAGSSFKINSNGDGTFSLAYQFVDEDGATVQVLFGTIAGYGTPTVTVTSLTYQATDARLEDLFDDFVYVIVGDNPAAGDRTVTLTFNDGGNVGGGAGLTATRTQTLSVVAVNDAPTLDLNGAAGGTGSAADYTEQAGPSILAADLIVADPDDTNIEGATLTISAGFQAGVDYLTVNGATSGISGGISWNYGVQSGVLTLTGSATVAAYQTLLRKAGFESASDAPGGSRTVAWKVNDGSLDSNLPTTTVTVTATPDAAVAKPDAVTTPENQILNGNLFADNGSGIDRDPDGEAVTIALVNGQAANVGATITLASGAKLTVNASGTFSYDPNGKFNHLISASKAAATGTVNNSQKETFTYALTDGNQVTVTVDVTGVDGAGDWLQGDSGHNTITGTSQGDFFMLDGGGNDTVSGLAGDDHFYFGGAYTTADTVNGGAGTDTLGLHGVYGNLVFTATSLTGIERIGLYSSTTSGQPGPFSYTITTHDGNVAAGESLFVTAAALKANETLTFIGMAETDGALRVQGGAGADLIIGGGGNDFLTGNGGNDYLSGKGGDDYLVGGAGQDQLRGGFGWDVFRFLAASDSTVAAPDKILDFQSREKIDLSVIDANSKIEGDQAFTFIGSAAFSGAGQLRAAYDADTKLWSVEGDVDGDGNADFLILVSRPASDTPIVAGEFYL